MIERKAIALVSAGLCLCVSVLIGAQLRVDALGDSFPDQSGQDSKPFDQQQTIQELKKQIAGQDKKPAEEVFKNIQILKGIPAGRVLAVMEIGYSKSLGVNCTHCHVVNQWEKDDKPEKQITREMSAMARTINTDLLKKIKNLKNENPIVNCTTCHRGQVKPALNLP
jgi:photosynthetic reaction center cytochrome c subunit